MPAKKDPLTEAVADWKRKRTLQTAANKKAAECKKDAKDAMIRVAQLLEARGQDGVRVGGQIASRYEIIFARITDRKAFEKWARKQDETYIEAEPRVIEDRVNQLVRSYLDDEKPLPPGLDFYPDERVSLTKAK